MKRREVVAWVTGLLMVAALTGCAGTSNMGGGAMSVQETKALGDRFAKAWAKGDLAAMDEILAPDFVAHGLPPDVAPGRVGYKQFMRAHHAGFSDFRVTVEDVVAEGDRIARRVTWSGTHTGPYMGIEPTGKQAAMVVISIERIEAGRIAEQWAVGDVSGLMRQLGAAGPPGQPKE